MCVFFQNDFCLLSTLNLTFPLNFELQYELIISVANAALNINSILATQFLQFTDATACAANDDASCTNSVDIRSPTGFSNTDGPNRFANYTYMIIGINIAGTLIFTFFLPRSKEECHDWRKQGEMKGSSHIFGYASVVISSAIVIYGILCSGFLLSPETSCIPVFGGDGC